MAAATYRIGPGDFFTPGDLQADADTLDGQVSMMDASIDGNEAIPQDQWDQFTVWMSDWRRFYSDHFKGYVSSVLSALNDSNRDQLISFENQFQDWVSRLQKSGVAPAGPIVEPSKGSKDSLLDHLANGLGLHLEGATVILVLIALVVVWKVVK